MIKRYGIALAAFGVLFFLAAGSARAGGLVAHITMKPIGPALNRGPVDGPFEKLDIPEPAEKNEASSAFQGREPVETGNLPTDITPCPDPSHRPDNGEHLCPSDTGQGQ